MRLRLASEGLGFKFGHFVTVKSILCAHVCIYGEQE